MLDGLTFGLLTGAAVGLLVGRWLERRRSASHRESPGTEAPYLARDTLPAPSDSDGPPPPTSQRLYDLADGLEADEANRFADPHDIVGVEAFETGVGLMADPSFPLDQVVAYSLGTHWVLGIMASEALARREDSLPAVEPVLANVGELAQWPLFFRLRFLAARAEAPVVGQVLSRIQGSWAGAPTSVAAVAEFLDERAAGGEDISFGGTLDEMAPPKIAELEPLIRRLPERHADVLLAEIARHRESVIDPEFASSAGRVWTDPIPGSPIYASEAMEEHLAEMRRAFRDAPPRSIVVVGEPGVGKSVLRRRFSEAILSGGWKIFETSGTELLSGTRYIGDIETRVAQLRKNAAARRRVALYVDRLGELATAGRSDRHPVSILDQMWPHLKAREVFLVSEVTPEGYQALERQYPGLAGVVKVLRIPPATRTETESLLEARLADASPDGTGAERSDIVSDTLRLAGTYLSHRAMPGSALRLAELALSRSEAQAEPLSRDHLLGALSELTGLPLEILDERQQLDVGALREDFERRVIGQREAVDRLVDRIAMLKAGLTDPQRPIGVFLFAGPTGTGKTEIAKTLAELLFGSPEQMIRLDMSELQTPESLDRLLGPSEPGPRPGSGSLVMRIRQQPFSVILLDEFEKAHANVWDLFLQVFDDGRLTDRQGELADFRHAIIILTSNLGATISSEAGIGFVGTRGRFSSTEVRRTVEQTFRREFINRLDDVVVFRPLSRDVMRLILRKELDDALSRRGFQSKEWAVEWEDSAVEFLLEKGFTPDLGARPLRRAIERHLLAPLSVTMVENRAPDGEQFLFVRSDGQELQVEFVDPDAGPKGSEGPTSERKEAGAMSVTAIIHDPTGAAAEQAFLAHRTRGVVGKVESLAWEEAKSTALAEMNQNDFWDRDDRHDVLHRVELMDRIEAATETVRALTERMDRNPRSASLARRVAEKLYVLEEGLRDLEEDRPGIVFLGVRLLRDDSEHPHAVDFLRRMAGMYRSWATRRRMQWTEIDPAGRDPVAGAVFSVAGFGSHAILSREEGLHVLEVPRDASRFDRIRIRVAVAPHLANPTLEGDALAREARAALGTSEEQATSVVRRYREHPSPLVRDSVGGWRTGRLDAIWEGDFDIWK